MWSSQSILTAQIRRGFFFVFFGNLNFQYSDSFVNQCRNYLIVHALWCEIALTSETKSSYTVSYPLESAQGGGLKKRKPFLRPHLWCRKGLKSHHTLLTIHGGSMGVITHQQSFLHCSLEEVSSCILPFTSDGRVQCKWVLTIKPPSTVLWGILTLLPTLQRIGEEGMMWGITHLDLLGPEQWLPTVLMFLGHANW